MEGTQHDSLCMSLISINLNHISVILRWLIFTLKRQIRNIWHKWGCIYNNKAFIWLCWHVHIIILLACVQKMIVQKYTTWIYSRKSTYFLLLTFVIVWTENRALHNKCNFERTFLSKYNLLFGNKLNILHNHYKVKYQRVVLELHLTISYLSKKKFNTLNK